MSKNLAGANVVVVGMARSGVAAVELLIQKGAHVHAVDSRKAEELNGAARRLGELGVSMLPQSQEAFRHADLVVVSPGVPADIPELVASQAAGVPTIGEVEL